MEYFSAFGEDKWIAENLKHIPIRTFCEVGAYNGVESSNTLAFEREGARGLLIEADETLAAQAMRNRPFTPVLCCAVGKEVGMALFYSVSPGCAGLNHPGSPRNVEVDTLYNLLKLAGLHKELDLLSIDTEGTDLDVISGLGPLRPRIIIAEFWTQPNPPIPATIKAGIEPLGYKEAHRTTAKLIFERL